MLAPVDITKHLEEMLGQPAKVPEPISRPTEWVMPVIRSGLEQESRDSLRRKGVGTWWPNYQREVVTTDRASGNRVRRQAFAPMLPGVLICAMPQWTDEHGDMLFWETLDRVPGVVNVLRRFNGDVIFLSDIDIVLLHKIEQGLNQTTPPKASRHAFKVGDKVRLIEDEYRCLPVAAVSEVHKDSIGVDINMFGAVRRMVVRAFQIEPVDSEPDIRAKHGVARDRLAKLPSRR